MNKNDNSGAIFPVKERKSDKHPSLSGKVTIEGKEWFVVGWTNNYEDTDGTLDFVVGTLNQDTTGTAAIATTVTVADESSDTTCFPLFATAATGNLAPKSGSNLAFNSSNGTLTATAFSGDGSALTGISAGATGGGSDEIFYENGQTVTTNYTITNGKNAMSAGPITIDSGVTVTVGSGETYTIV